MLLIAYVDNNDMVANMLMIAHVNNDMVTNIYVNDSLCQ